MIWIIHEYPNGFEPRIIRAKNPTEVAHALRLPWSQGYYKIERVEESDGSQPA